MFACSFKKIVCNSIIHCNNILASIRFLFTAVKLSHALLSHQQQTYSELLASFPGLPYTKGKRATVFRYNWFRTT